MTFAGFNLAGKVAIVIGASRGIGRTICLGLANAGADIVVASRSLVELEMLAGEIRQLGKRVLVCEVDVTERSTLESMVVAATSEFGDIDILVYNSGINVVKPALEISEEEWDMVLDTNLKGCFLANKTVGKVLVSQRKGKIINMSSTFGLVGFEQRSAYAASKGGICQLTKVLAIEWGPFNVCVNAIAPTATKTAMNENLFSNENWQREMLRKIPLQRFCNPFDIVGATVFLASEASNMVTGITLPVDGGYTSL